MDNPGFDLGFGLTSGEELPADIGTWKIQYIKKKKGEPIDKTEVDIKKCDEKSLTWETPSKGLSTAISKMNCSDVFESIIKGEFRSDEFNYVKIGLKACEPSKKFKCRGKRARNKWLAEKGNNINMVHPHSYTDKSVL